MEKSKQWILEFDIQRYIHAGSNLHMACTHRWMIMVNSQYFTEACPLACWPAILCNLVDWWRGRDQTDWSQGLASWSDQIHLPIHLARRNLFGCQELISLNLKGISSRHAECWSFVLCDSFVVVVSPRPLLVVPACCCCCQCWHLATVQRGYFHRQCGRVLSAEHIDLGCPEKVRSTSLKSKIDGSLLILFSSSDPPKIQALPWFLPLPSDTPQSKHTNEFSLSSLPWAVQKASFEQRVKCCEQFTLYSNSSKNLSMINALWAKTFQKHMY